jgi:hypothetical protein
MENTMIGNRYNTLFRAAVKAVTQGLSEEAVCKQVLSKNEAFLEPLPQREVEHLLAGANRYRQSA